MNLNVWILYLRGHSNSPYNSEREEKVRNSHLETKEDCALYTAPAYETLQPSIKGLRGYKLAAPRKCFYLATFF